MPGLKDLGKRLERAGKSVVRGSLVRFLPSPRRPDGPVDPKTVRRVLAVRLQSLANVGCYVTGAGVAIQLMIGPWVLTSVYDIPVIDLDLFRRWVVD